MNEVITGIRVIKMYAWEYAFKRIVTAIRKYVNLYGVAIAITKGAMRNSLYYHLRRHESRLIRYGGVIKALASAFNYGGAISIMMGLTFLTFIGTGGKLTTQRVFTTLSLVVFLNRISVDFIVRCFFLLSEATVALNRIQVQYILTSAS